MTEEKKTDSRTGDVPDTTIAKPLFYDQFIALQRWVYRIAKMKGFHKKPRDKGLVIALIHSEVSELLEAVRTVNPEPSEHIPEFTAEEEELADIIIRVLDYAEEFGGLDVVGAIFAKTEYNAKRAYMHGKKF